MQFLIAKNAISGRSVSTLRVPAIDRPVNIIYTGFLWANALETLAKQLGNYLIYDA